MSKTYYHQEETMWGAELSTHGEEARNYIISVKADNFIVSLCHWQLRPW
jgi:hypothetical protein